MTRLGPWIAALAGLMLTACISQLWPFTETAGTARPPSTTAGSSIQPGSTQRTSKHLDVDYDADIRLEPRRSRMLARLTLTVRNTSGGPIGRVILTSAEKLPTRVTSATVDGRAAATDVSRGRIVLGLGGTLLDGDTTTLRLALVLPLCQRFTGLGYFHAARDGVIQIAEWLPRVDAGFTRTIRAHVRAPAGWTVAVGSLERARELPIVASRRYRRVGRTVGRTRLIMLYERGGRAAAAATLAKASHALPWTERRLGPQPRLRITFAQINSDRLAYSWPGIIWLPDNLAPSGLDVYVAHELAHQWFGGIVPTRNRQLEPFTGEAPSEVVSRLFRHALRPSRCPGMRLDLTRKAYGGCLYEAIYVDGANVLNMVRKRMGDGAFWRALRGYVRDNRFQPVGTHDVLDALRRASRANLDPLLHRRFPSIVP